MAPRKTKLLAAVLCALVAMTCPAQAQAQAQDNKARIDTLRQEADAGNAHAQYLLGLLYYTGRGGIGKNDKEAISWWRKAAKQGDRDAKVRLSTAFRDADLARQDAAEVNLGDKRWLKKAEAGDPVAQNNVGLAYYNGIGVEKDYVEAVQWYHRAADQGNAAAQLNLGIAYHNGEGVAKSDKKAVYWYRKAARHGNAIAELNMGEAYFNGQGVAIDDKQAVDWYRKAAEQGNVDAEFYLGMAYYNGPGVTPDDMQAALWLGKAAAQGNTEAQELVKQSSK